MKAQHVIAAASPSLAGGVNGMNLLLSHRVDGGFLRRSDELPR